MRVSKMIAAATLPAMIASPVGAANPAASLSLRGDTSATSNDSNAASATLAEVAPATAGGIPSGVLIGGLVVVLVVAGAIALGSGHHNSHPASA